MITEFENGKIRIEPFDWRFSATIVGLAKYFDYHSINFDKNDDYIEFEQASIDEERYLQFVEHHFADSMHHKIIESLMDCEIFTDAQIKLGKEKLAANTVMKKFFKEISFNIESKHEIQTTIMQNRKELIKETFKSGKALYANYCNTNCLLADKKDSCRLLGYSIDMGKKGKSVAFMRDSNTFVYQDSQLFDFISFAFSKTREAFFINNNFSIGQLLHSNKNDLLSEEHTARSQLFFKLQNSSSFIDYDVEVIKKERDKDHFETIFVRKEAIRIFEKIDDATITAISKPCNAKKSDSGQDTWLNIENEVTVKILNSVKLDDLIEQLLKASNGHNYLISHLIKINQMIYREDDSMNDKQRRAYASAMEVKSALKGRENKIRAYEQRLISAITVKDYEKVQTVLLHLSSFTQVKMDFLIDLFEDFESNKNLAYTFINVLGDKKDFKPKTNNGDDQNGK